MRFPLAAWACFLTAGILLAGCSGGSVIPGLGGSTGISTPGGGLGNPDATLYFRMSGTDSGDFIAPEAVGRSVLGGRVRIEATYTSGEGARQRQRNIVILMNTAPTAGRTYTVGDFGPGGALLDYSELDPRTNVLSVWEGISGSIRVERIEGDRVIGKFDVALDPIQNATSRPTIHGGVFSVKVI
jgi:hypothetical protein